MKPEYRMRRSNMKILDQIQERAKPKISLKQIFYKYKKKRLVCPKKKGAKCKCK